jgi:dephospho-CoA kinase
MGLRVFGLTGGIASGKSSVAAFWRSHRLPVIDADELARQVVAPGTEGLAEVVQFFGTQALLTDGTLDRVRVAGLVFESAEARRALEAITHPRIHTVLEKRLSMLQGLGEPLACYEAPLLIETGRADRYRPLVVVTASPETQLKRAALRDAHTEATVTARINAQLSIAKKVELADFVICNDSNLQELESRAKDTLRQICERFAIDFSCYDWCH